MADQPLSLRNFAGGLSDDDAYGQDGSFSEGLAIDSRQSPGYITLHRQLQKESGSVVTTEIHDAVRVDANSGDVYLAGGSKIYKRSPGSNGSAGTYIVSSEDENLTNVQDLDYRPDIDSLFLIDNRTIHELSPIVNGTSTYAYDKYREFISNSQTGSSTAVTFTADSATDTLTATAHGLSNGEVVLVQSTGTLPGGLSASTRYYVINQATNTFQLSATSGGSAIDITSNGTGTLSFTRGGYEIPTGISETEYWAFSLDKEPIFSVNLTVSEKGTGDWTATIHDGANHEIGAATLQNSQIPNAGYDAVFQFSAPVRAKLGATYHVHVVSSDGTGAIQSTNANTLQAANASLKVDRLVDTGDFGHATLQVGATTLICNERYLAIWEILDVTDNATAGFNPHGLVFPAEVISIGMAEYSEYTMIACALKRSTDSIHDTPTEGIIFGWNNTDEFTNFKIPVPQGVPYSIFSINNTVYWEAAGTWYRWAGGDPEPVYQFPGVDRFIMAENGPTSEAFLRAGRKVMAANPNNTVSIGFPYASANTNARLGLFSFGKSKGFMPPAINYNGIISTGSESPQFDTTSTPNMPITGITLVKRFGTNLLVAWKDFIDNQIVYGIDYVNDTSPAAARGVYGSLWFSNARPDKEKTPKAIKAVFKEALPAGCSITPFIQYDRSETRHSETVAVEGEREAVFSIEVERRFYEVIAGVILESTEGNFPYVTSINFKFDDNTGDGNDTEVARDWPADD